MVFSKCTEAVFSPDGKTVATLHKDNTLRLWQMPLRKPAGLILGISANLWLLVLLAGMVLGRMRLKRRKRLGHGQILAPAAAHFCSPSADR
jgi:hypothetical protein